MSHSYSLRVPASTANLGPGFDCLGLALKLYNYVRVRPAERTSVLLSGHGGQELPRDESNLMLRSAAELARRAGRQLPPLAWEAHHDLPLARGLGSSSAAIVAGVLVADAVLGLGLPRRELVRVAAEIEGHPDNVAPALLGGLTICLPGSEPLQVGRIEPHPDLRVVLLLPHFQISTAEVRQVLPQSVPYADAVFNLSRAAAVVAALREGQWELLGQAMEDRLHQPYRLPLMPGVAEVMQVAREAGAHGVALSGSGPTVAAFCTDRASAVARTMLEAAGRLQMPASALVAAPELQGAGVTLATQEAD